METGTGKTLVYIQTIFELYKNYGFSKFIILVPSVAIREGVLSTLQDFESQLENKYNIKPHYFEYDSKQLNRIREFAESQHLQIMVTTLQSFIREDNILNQTEREDQLIPEMSFLQTIAQTRPIIVMDEPQEGMDTEKAINRIASLKPLFKLRYSATHRVAPNLIYQLTPQAAYRQNLVKRIVVISVAERDDEGALKLELEKIHISNHQPRVTIKAYHQNKSRFIAETSENFSFKLTKKLSRGDDLAQITRNNSYEGYIIEDIVAGPPDGQPYIKFRNGVVLNAGRRATDYQAVFNLQLYHLIKAHLDKKEQLSKLGIKCLSLIFIDKVDNYVASDGIIKLLFEQNYSKAYREKYGNTPSSQQIQDRQGSYFATTTKGDYTDNERSMVNNKKLYDLILRDKEKLLSFKCPIEFVFSHSALGVGWDNPNVFNICTLNQNKSEITKRQKLGRGLRICLNQAGKRIYDQPETPEDQLINELSVVPNESYEAFASGYQRELGGEEISLRNKPLGKDQYNVITRNDSLYKSATFDDFWTKISQKTEYIASFDEGKLIEEAAKELSKIYLNTPKIEVDKRVLGYAYNQDLLGGSKNEISSRYKGSALYEYNPHFAPLDLINEISQQTTLTKQLVVRAMAQIENKSQIVKNPPAFIQQAVQRLQSLLARESTKGEGLKYRAINAHFSKTELKKVVKTTCLPKKLESTKKKGIYDYVVCDSEIESNFVRDVAGAGEIDLFLKLPPFYKIKTPVGNYNPDFGIILLKSDMYDQTTLFFVVETKTTNCIEDENNLTLSEIHKMQYAHKHFEALGFSVQYIAPVTDYQKFKAKTRRDVGLK